MDAAPGGHGGEVYSLARKLRIRPEELLDYSSNANLFALPITEALVRDTPLPFKDYPDSACADLVSAIARHEDMEPDRILPGNGAADLIWQAARTLAPRKVLCVGPMFSEFIRAFTAFGIPCDLLTPPAEADFACGPAELEALWNSDADLAVICTPNNPATVVYSNILAMLEMIRAPRVIIDNSYREFLYGTDDYALNHLRRYQAAVRPGVGLFTLHSFTKFYCCPGIRLGYLMGDRPPLARMAAQRPAWHIGSQAQVMGRRFLEETPRYRESLPELREAGRVLAMELRRLPCFRPERVLEGPGFLCCGLAQGLRAGEVCDRLLRSRILVRDCDGIPGMPPGYIRLRARGPEDNARLLEALENINFEM